MPHSLGFPCSTPPKFTCKPQSLACWSRDKTSSLCARGCGLPAVEIKRPCCVFAVCGFPILLPASGPDRVHPRCHGPHTFHKHVAAFSLPDPSVWGFPSV